MKSYALFTCIAVALVLYGGCDMGRVTSESVMIRHTFTKYASEGTFSMSGLIDEEGKVNGDLIQLDNLGTDSLIGWRSLICPQGALVIHVNARVERQDGDWSARGTYEVIESSGIFEHLEAGAFSAHLPGNSLQQYEEMSGTIHQ